MSGDPRKFKFDVRSGAWKCEPHPSIFCNVINVEPRSWHVAVSHQGFPARWNVAGIHVSNKLYAFEVALDVADYFQRTRRRRGALL